MSMLQHHYSMSGTVTEGRVRRVCPQPVLERRLSEYVSKEAFITSESRPAVG